MTYRATRIYDVALRTLYVDYRSAMMRSIDAIIRHKSQIKNGFLCATLKLRYPNPDLVRNEALGWRSRVLDLLKRVDNCFEKIYWTLAKQKGNLCGVFEVTKDPFPLNISAPKWFGQLRFIRSIVLKIPIREFNRSLKVFRILLRLMISPLGFQYVEEARLKTTYLQKTTGGLKERFLHGETVEVIEWPFWLKESSTEEALDFFFIPDVAENITDQCKGLYMIGDQARDGESMVRRNIRIDGIKQPITITEPDDVIYLTSCHHLFAFYMSCEGLPLPSENRTAVDYIPKLRQVCIDLDNQWLISAILGLSKLWRLDCQICEAILSLVFKFGIPPPALKFSGAKGMHMYWRVEPNALGMIYTDLEPYLTVAYEVDPTISAKKTTKVYLGQFMAMKTIIQALVARAMFEEFETDLPEAILDKLGLEEFSHLIAFSTQDHQMDSKIRTDILSMPQGVFRTALSPHKKTGLISRNIRGPLGGVDTPFMDWGLVKRYSTLEYVAEEIQRYPERHELNPGILTRYDLERLADNLSDEIYMLLKFGQVNMMTLPTESYHEYLCYR